MIQTSSGVQVAATAICTPVCFDSRLCPKSNVARDSVAEILVPEQRGSNRSTTFATPDRRLPAVCCVLTIADPQDEKLPTPNPKPNQQSASARKLVDTVLADSRPVAKVWDEILVKQGVDSALLADAVSILHELGRYDIAVEAIQSAIRNDLAAAWMYDVLAVEMKLAKRPANEIARAVESRIDFANADIPELLIAVALLSQFEAWDDAMRICREATELNPNVSHSWLMARRVADKTRNPEHRVWARCGILQHVWTDDSAALHEEANKVITEIAAQFDKAGDSPQAERIRAQLREASAIDLMLVLRWVGSADLDLLVTEPNGEQCSFKNRLTTGGGRFAHDDPGSAKDGNAKRYEQYVCRVTADGEYKATVRFVLGKAVAGTAILEIVRHARTPEESRSTQSVKLTRDDVQIPIDLKRAR